MKYKISTASLLGNRSSNQDSFGVAEEGGAILLALSDGMAGHDGGKLAADTFIESAILSFNQTTVYKQDPKLFLEQVISIAHKEILHVGKQQTPPIQPRTTCVLCLIMNGSAWWAHVGDSRLYLLRHGLKLIHTVDHSKVECLFKLGEISAKEKRTHPERHLLVRCLGVEQKPPEPTISNHVMLQSGDVMLLCSDGLWGPLIEEQITSGLNQPNLDHAVDFLASQAEKTSYPNCDNISAIAFRWFGKNIEAA